MRSGRRPKPNPVWEPDNDAPQTGHGHGPGPTGYGEHRGNRQHARVGKGTTVSLDLAPRRPPHLHKNRYYAEWGAPEPTEKKLLKTMESLRSWLTHT